MSKSVDKNIVAPKTFVDDPQSHFSKLRLEEAYHVELNGKHIKGSREISIDVTQHLRSTQGGSMNLGEDEIILGLSNDLDTT